MRRLDGASVEALALLSSPVWVFDLDVGLPWWANAATLALFGAPDVETLRARLEREPMTAGTERRLAGYRDAFSRGESITEDWTLYPEGRAPALVRCTGSGVTIALADGQEHEAALFEGRVVDSQLGAHERRLVEALRHCNELISMLTREGTMITRNPAALEAFGTRPFAELFAREEDRERAMGGWTRERPPLREDLPMLTRSGRCWYDTEIRAMQDPVTGDLALLVVQHDITRVRASLEAQRAARVEADALRTEAEAASRAKSVFLATMSHELRTPMTGVLAAAELLADSALDRDQREALEMVVQGGTQMVAIIDDVLHVARDDLGESTPTVGRVELSALVTATLQPLAVAAQEKRLRLASHIDPALPVAIASDARRLRQILTNLVANAIRYTDEGGVDVRLQLDGEATLRVEVVDTGIGISEAAVERLFQAFHQESTERGGTGLGLHIARSIARALGGEVGARGEPGVGSVFWVTLPITAAEEGTGKRKVDTGPLGLRILVVDDNALNRRAFARVLRRWRCDVTEAQDGLRALELLEANAALDAILMDVNMPRMNGIDATRAIRARYGRRLPVIALTADTLQESDALFDGLLHKPVDWQRLHAILQPIAARAS